MNVAEDSPITDSHTDNGDEVALVAAMRSGDAAAFEEAPGLAPRGEPMPQTVGEWQYLAGLYAKQIEDDAETIRKLKQRVNKLEQRK